jgi:hypothetical protein
MVKKNNDLESYGTFCEYLLLNNYESTFDYFKQKLEVFLKNPDYSEYPAFAKAVKNLQSMSPETKEFTNKLLHQIKTYHSGKKKLFDELRNAGVL